MHDIDSVMVNITVNCMLNPNNKDFYIGNLTEDKVDKILSNADIETINIFNTARSIAEDIYASDNVCPMCGCTHKLGYVKGVHCPNCDYVED